MSRIVNKSKTARLVPSANSVTNYLTVNDAANMYTNVDSTTYSQIDHTSTSNGAVGYLMVRGFNFSEIPSNATVSGYTIKYKATQSALSAATGMRARLLSGTSSSSTMAGSAATYVTSTSTQTIEFTGVTATWATLSGYGNNFGIRHALRRASRNTSGYERIYGHEIAVNYSVPVTEYEVAVTNLSSANVTGDDYIESGESGTIYFTGIQNASEISVTDNNVDVSSSLQPASGIILDSAEVGAVSNASYGFVQDGQYYKSQNAGVSYSAALCRVTVTAATGCTLRFYVVNYAEATYDYGIIGKVDTSLLTTSAVTDTSNWTWAGSASTSNSSSEQTVNVIIPAGTHYVDVKFRKDNATNSNNDALWFRYELVNATTTTGFSYTLSNVSTDHTITVDDAGTFTFYDVSASSSYNGATITPASQSIREGRPATVNIAVNNLYEITVKDNGTNVTNSLVQNATGYTYTISNIAANHTIVVEEGTYYNVTTTSSFAGASATANPTKVYAGQSSVVNFTFDHLYEFVAKDNGTVISVPEPVPATTVEYVPSSYNSSASNHGAVYNNSTGNGLTPASSTTYSQVSSNTAANSESLLVYNFDCSAIPQDAVIDSISCSAKGSASTNYFTTRTFQLYAGDTAKGSPVTISNNTVQSLTPGTWTREELNDIRIVERVVRGTSTTSQRFRFDGATLTITYSVPASYTINNVQEAHTITIEEAPYYGVTIQNSYAGASFSVEPTKIYSGRDAVVTININDIDEIHVFDNGTNVDASIVSAGTGVYTYTITNVTTAHTISTTESTKYALSATSNYTGVTISPATVNTIEGKNQTFLLEPYDDSIIVDQDVILTDNNVDVTNQLVVLAGETGTTTGVLGTFDEDMSSYVGIYNNSHTTNAEGNSVSDAYASTSGTRSSFYTTTGAGSTILVVYNLDASGIVIPDNATIVNVSCQSVHSIAYSGQGFTEISAQLYSGNVAKGDPTDIRTGRSDASAHTYTIDGGSAWTMNDLSQAKIALSGVRNNTNSNNDNTGVRDNVNFHGADLIVTYALPGGCMYTVTNVQETHTLLVTEKPSVSYSITCQSTYTGATITPESAHVKQGRSLTVHISASNLYEFTVKDNGNDVTEDVKGSSGDYTYTISNVNSARSILVEEATKYAITASSTYQNATITPASMNIYAGQSGTFEISAPSLNYITLEDNGLDVTSRIVYVSGETFMATGGTLGTFDEDNSQYVGNYTNSSNVTFSPDRAEGKSAAEGMAETANTRSSFYTTTGSGSTIAVTYNIDTTNISLPEGVVILGVSAVSVNSIAYSGDGYSSVTLQL